MIKISHIGICVSDLDRSLRFYTQVLGAKERLLVDLTKVLPEDYRSTMFEMAENIDGYSKFLELDGFLIELLYYTRDGHPGGHVGSPGRRPMNGLGYTHLCVRTEDAQEAEVILAKAREYGGEVLENSRMVALQIDGEDVGPIMFLDPDGTRIELLRAPTSFRVDLGED